MNRGSSISERLAFALLERFCGVDYIEELWGDLEETFHQRLQGSTPVRAHFRLWLDVLSLLRTRFVRKPVYRGGPIMLKSTFRVAWRGVLRNRSYSIINVVGLSAGLACCILIGLFMADELSFDTFHEHAPRIHRITTVESDGATRAHLATTAMPLVPYLADGFTSIENATRVHPYPALVRIDDASGTPVMSQEDALAFVDSTFFDVFSFPLLAGDPRSVLDAPFSLVLTESAASRLFGSADPIGKTVSVSSSEEAFDFTVTGLAADVPHNSHFRFSMVANIGSLLSVMESHRDSWYWPPVYSYVLLSGDHHTDRVETELRQQVTPFLAGMGLEQEFHLQPLRDIHLHSNLQNEAGPNGSFTSVVLFGAVATLILLIAGINFTNLATARSSGRAREVGMRKVMGAERRQIMSQFLAESTVTTFVAILLAMLVVWLALPSFNTLAGKDLDVGDVLSWQSLSGLTALLIFVGILTGAYPAFLLSGVLPIRALRGGGVRGGAAALRRVLVVFQFSITSVLIVSTLVIDRQLEFLQNDRLGFDQEHVVIVPLRERDNQMNHDTLKEEWLRDPRILHASASSGYPSYTEGVHGFRIVAEDSGDSVHVSVLTVDEEYAETFGLEVIAGRDFSRDRPTDASNSFMINEAAARMLGWENPVGKKLSLEYYVYGPVEKRGEIIGVFRDFQITSLHDAVDPIVMHVLPGSFYNDFISVRLSPGDVTGALAHLEAVWTGYNPDRPFEFRFLDDVVDSMYRSDVRLGRILGVFSILAIWIACLGLFALAAYTTEQRTREIGVRKVLGASTAGIVVLLSSDFMKLIVLAFGLALPLAWIVTDHWLDGFAERITPGWGLFLLAAAIAFAIGVGAVSLQAVRAATTNPADCLRSE